MPESRSDRDKWNLHYQQAADEAASPAAVLRENLHLLPAKGLALDLACGLGANALLLAEHGFEAYAWDISDVAIAQLSAAAQRRILSVHAQVRDVVALPPLRDSFDVIVVSFFLERALAPRLSAALRPQGVLFYQTYTRARVDDSGPRNEAYRLADNELLELFPSLHVLAYREEGRTGDLSRGFRNQALLVAQKLQ